MENILAHEQLLIAIQAGLGQMEATQMTRLTEVTMSDLPDDEKRKKAREIMDEKYDVNAVLNSLKKFVEFEGNIYEYKPVAVAVVKEKSVGTTGTKSTGRFSEGDRIKYVQDLTESPVYIVTNGQVKNEETGEVMNAGHAVLLHKLALKKQTEAEFRAEFEQKNGRKFTGYAGFSDLNWNKVI